MSQKILRGGVVGSKSILWILAILRGVYGVIGSKQGAVLSPILFAVYIDGLLGRL